MSNSSGGSDNCRGGKINAQKIHNSGNHSRNRDRPHLGLVGRTNKNTYGSSSPMVDGVPVADRDGGGKGC